MPSAVFIDFRMEKKYNLNLLVTSHEGVQAYLSAILAQLDSKYPFVSPGEEMGVGVAAADVGQISVLQNGLWQRKSARWWW